MSEGNWQQARLIPTSGINGPDEAERRATSAVLAVMGSVREFGQAIVRPLGAPAGALTTFIEAPFESGERTIYPDGVLQSRRAGRTWTCLVEVKTGSSELDRSQVECYLDVARDNGFDGVLTISNQIAPALGVHPVDVDRRKLRKVALHHLSWAEVLTIAVQQRVHRGVSDPDQAWVLGELIRYLEHPKSGALDFSDMGQSWVPIREAVAAGTLRATDRGLADVISRWEQLLRFAALRLGRELGADVQVQVGRREAADPSVRFAAQTQNLVGVGCLNGTLRIPHAVAPIDVIADVRASRVTVSVDVAAPREGRAATRVNWLVRQLRDAPDGLRVDAFATASRASTSELLRTVREDVTCLVGDPKRDLRMFRVAATSSLGAKRGTGRGGFVDSVLVAIDGFYETVVQQLRPWTVKAPQLPGAGRSAAEEAGIDIDPPVQDLLEPAELSELDLSRGAEMEEAEAPAIVQEAVELIADESSPSGREGSHQAPSEVPARTEESGATVDRAAAEDFVRWDSAHDRLDQERIRADERADA